jgi:hypothetical protein
MMTPVPHGITLARALDLNYFGSKIGHSRTDERPGHQLTHFDHTDTG